MMQNLHGDEHSTDDDDDHDDPYDHDENDQANGDHPDDVVPIYGRYISGGTARMVSE